MGQSLSASLLLATRTGNANGVKQLVEQGVDIHSTFEDEKTALHVAAEEGRDEVLSLLISLGGKVTTTDKQKYTPLHSAVFMGHATSAALLIESGADVNSVDVSGMTPLHWAVKTARLNCVELLMSKGANLHAKNLKGETALDLANKIKPRKLRPDIVRALEGVLSGGPLPTVSLVPVVESERVIRLRHLCIIWGIIKYAHPHLQYKTIDWDSALINTIPLVSKSSSPKDYLNAINKLLSVVGDSNTKAVLRSESQTEAKAKTGGEKAGSISLSVTEDRYALISLLDCNQFQDFSQARRFVQVFTEARVKAKGVVFDCRCEEYGNVSPIIYLKQMFYEAFRIFINDTFYLSSSRTRVYRGHHLEWNRFDSENYFEGSLTLDGEMLLPPTLPTPTQPTPTGKPVPNITSSPAPTAQSTASPSTPVRAASIPLPNSPPPASPSLRSSSSSTSSPPSTPANPRLALTTPLPQSPAPTRDSSASSTSTSTPPVSLDTEEKPKEPESNGTLKETAPPMAFIVNKSTPGCLIDLISALQAKGMAFTIFEDSELTSEDQKDKVIECGVPTIKVNASDDVDVYIRTADRVNPDGTIGFAPDLVVSQADDIIEKVVGRLETGNFVKSQGQVVVTPNRPLQSSGYVSRPFENEYLVDSLTPEIRLLALFKFWNVVESFYPYKDNFTEDWSRVLSEFIPVFEDVNTPLDYSLAVARLVSRLNDTHAYASSPILNDYMGTHVPPLIVQRLEEKTIVTFADSSLSSDTQPGPVRGDELVSIDGVEEQKVRDKLANIIPASTPQAKSWRIDQLLLAGKPNSTVTIVTKNPQGQENTYTLTRTAHPSFKPTDDNTAPYRVVDLGIGYIDTVRLNTIDLDRALTAVKDQACLIIDVRGFPQYTLQELVARLTHHPERILQLQTPFRIASSFAQSSASMITETVSITPHKNSINYQGKVVVLINEKTASFAEQNLLYLESVCSNLCGGVTFVGTATNGSVGKLTNVKLPGEIYVGLSGVAMRGISGKAVQGVGLKPHVVVEPTVAGIVANQDEVYLGAIKYCKSYLQAPVVPVNQTTGVKLNINSDTETTDPWPEV